MEVEQIDLKLLSEALGELARGFKKLKTGVDGLKISGEKVPIPKISDKKSPRRLKRSRKTGDFLSPQS